MAAGEVLLSRPFSGTSGNWWNLNDASVLTWWDSTYPTGDWFSMDAGAPITLSRVRLSPVAGWEDVVIGGKILGSNTPFGPQLVQSNYKILSTGAPTTVTLAFPKAVTPGNCIVIAFGASALGKTATATVTDNLGNAYSVGATPTTSVPRAMYYALNVAGGADTITVQFSTSQAFIELEIAEFSGVLSVNALDGSTSNSFTTATTTPNSGALTTTTSQDLLVCSFWGAGSPAITAGSNFFKIFTETGANTSMEYGISGPQGSCTGTWTFSVTETAQVQMIALKTIAPQAIANAANILTFSQRPPWNSPKRV